MNMLVPIVLILLVLLPFIGIGFGLLLRKRAGRTLAAVKVYCERQGWRQVNPDPRITERTLLLVQAEGLIALRIQAQFAGEYRGIPFEAVQLLRPASQMHTTMKRYSLVLVPRPVPGPRLQLAKQGLSSATFLNRDTKIGHPQFDAAFHVHTEDAAFAQAVLHPGLAGALTSDARALRSVVAFEAQHLAALRHGELTPDVLQETVNLLTDVHGAVPWQQLAGRP